jgi:fatty-acyl-CoA synthase
MFFNDWLSRRRLLTPDRVAIVDDTAGRQFSYAQLDTRAARLANYLSGPLDIRPGDRIACLSANRVELIDLYFACGKIGAVLVPLNFRQPAEAVVELLRDCQPRLLVYELQFAQLADTAKQSGTVSVLLPIETTEMTSAVRCLMAVLATSDELDPMLCVHEANENEVAMILYTSGTTGRAKGAMITWRQIHWNALNTIIGLQLTQDDAAFLNMPLYHTGAWHVLFSPLMLLGGRIILQQQFDAERCNARMGPAGVTILFAVPTMMRMISTAANFDSADFSRVRFAICGGEPCPLTVIEAYQARGVAVRQGYGLTEAGPNCFSLPAEDAVRKQGSIGFPNFHVGVRLLKEDESEAEIGEVGELWMKGPHLFAGYWANAEETATTLRQGWLATGDLLTRDEHGYYYIVGRKKDMYVSGGENVYPARVERILQSHQTIASAAVVAAPHPKWGETGWAFVQPHTHCEPTEDDLLNWCKQHLASYECPLKMVMMEDLPKGPSGKIDKRALRKLVEQDPYKP